MRLAYNDVTIDVHFSPSAHSLTKEDIIDTATSLASSLDKPGELLVDLGMVQYVIVRGESNMAHIDVTYRGSDLSFATEGLENVDFDFDF